MTITRLAIACVTAVACADTAPSIDSVGDIARSADHRSEYRQPVHDLALRPDRARDQTPIDAGFCGGTAPSCEWSSNHCNCEWSCPSAAQYRVTCEQMADHMYCECYSGKTFLKSCNTSIQGFAVPCDTGRCCDLQ